MWIKRSEYEQLVENNQNLSEANLHYRMIQSNYDALQRRVSANGIKCDSLNSIIRQLQVELQLALKETKPKKENSFILSDDYKLTVQDLFDSGIICMADWVALMSEETSAKFRDALHTRIKID